MEQGKGRTKLRAQRAPWLDGSMAGNASCSFFFIVVVKQASGHLSEYIPEVIGTQKMTPRLFGPIKRYRIFSG